MFNHSTLKSENPFISYPEDGLVDIFIGLGIFFAGLFLWANMVWMMGIFIPAFLPSFQSIRNNVLEPRIGKFVANSNQYAKNQKITLYVTLIMGILVLVGFCIFFLFEFISWPGINVVRQYILLVLGMIFASLWILAGAMLNIHRYLLYAALTLVVMGVAQFSNIPFWINFVIMGGILVFVGILVFIRFLQKYPHK